MFEIVDAEVASEVCPLFFRLGLQDTLARLCVESGFERVGGPVTLAWSRFDDAVRTRAGAISNRSPRGGPAGGDRVPGEFVVGDATAPGSN